MNVRMHVTKFKIEGDKEDEPYSLFVKVEEGVQDLDELVKRAEHVYNDLLFLRNEDGSRYVTTMKDAYELVCAGMNYRILSGCVWGYEKQEAPIRQSRGARVMEESEAVSNLHKNICKRYAIFKF